MKHANSPAGNTLLIEAPARLHLGFVDLNGNLGRRFGSVGLAIDGLSTHLVATRSDRNTASGIDAQRALHMADRVVDALGLDGGVALQILQAIPPHSGLGSGTQMALAVGTAISRIYRRDLNAYQIASLLDRGARSGIGIAAFEQGGFTVDGGRRQGGGPPVVISRLEFPQHWRILLIFDESQRGIHGASEREAFQRLPVFSEQAAAQLCRLLTMQLLPGLAERRLDEFAAAVHRLQTVVGDYFSPVQGGRYASPAVTAVLDHLLAQGCIGLGQSSWGPTGFVILEGETEAFRLARDLRDSFADMPLRFQVVAGRNTGAVVESTGGVGRGDTRKQTARTAVSTQ